MKKYPSTMSTVRHIMLEYGGGVVPAMRKREGGDVKPVEKTVKKKKKVEMTKESFESRVSKIRSTIEEGSMGLKRLERLTYRGGVDVDPARVKYKVAKAKAAETDPDKYQDNMANRKRMAQHMETQTLRARNLMPTPKGETRYYSSDGTDVTASVNFRNSIGAVPHVAAQGRFTAHPDTQLASRTALTSSVPPAVAQHGMFTNVNDPTGKDPHMAAMVAYGGPHHPEGGAERRVEPIMISVNNFKSAHARGLPRGVSLTSAGVPNDFLSHAVGDNEHPPGLHRK